MLLQGPKEGSADICYHILHWLRDQALEHVYRAAGGPPVLRGGHFSAVLGL